MTVPLSEQSRKREEIARVGQSLFSRGLTFGATGNISVRLSDGSYLMTPTNVALGALDPARLSHIARDGTHLGGDKPTKEAYLHSCMYCKRASANAVVHLHSTHSVAVSIMEGLDPKDMLPPLTAYYVMRVNRLPLIPYSPPGSPELAHLVEQAAESHHAVLLANHGPVVAGASLEEAQYAIEELEETAKLFVLLQDKPRRPLSDDQAAQLRERMGR